MVFADRYKIGFMFTSHTFNKATDKKIEVATNVQINPINKSCNIHVVVYVERLLKFSSIFFKFVRIVRNIKYLSISEYLIEY